MAGRVFDITERLGELTRPTVVVSGKEYQIDNTAPAVTKVMAIVGDDANVSNEDALAALAVLIGEESAQAFYDGLPFPAFVELLRACTEVATGTYGEPDEGNAATPATT